MRAVLIGNYGDSNLGDEALKQYFLLHFPEIDWAVFSAEPQTGEYARLPFGIRSLLSLQWGKSLKALQNTDAVVFGGGSLLTDVESVSACLLWWWHAFVARCYRKPFLLACQGIGPFRTGLGAWCARWIVRRASFVSVRDRASFERVSSWGLNNNVIQTSDPVLSLIKAKNDSERSKNIFTVIPRMNSAVALRSRAQQIAKEKQWDVIQILSLQPQNTREQEFCEHLKCDLGDTATVVAIGTLDDLQSAVSKSALVLSERYHGALVALALHVPFETISQKEGDKLSSLYSINAEEELERVKEGEKALKEALSGL